ncbi:MAG: hypothetical protein AAF466_04525 [Bacteroidota bacterium]
MKTKIIWTFVCCLFLIGLWACNEGTHASNQTNESLMAQPDTCSLAGPLLTNYQIPDSVAVLGISSYIDYVEELKTGLQNNNDEFLIFGVEVQVEELYQLLCAVRQAKGSKLYIMDAIKVTDTNEFADMIFVVEPPAPSTPSSPQLEPNYYFDFTQPCPAACPSLFVNEIL